MKKFFTLFAVAMMTATTMWAGVTTYSPVKEYNMRPKADGSNFDAKKDASANATFEINHNARFFALQQYTISNLADVESLTLSLKGASSHGTDALAVWAVSTAWTEESTAAEINTLYATATGLNPGVAGTTTATYLLRNKSNTKTDLTDSNRECTFVIDGNALKALKQTASAEGTFTLLITNNKETVESNGNSKRQYYTSGYATESLRPTLAATSPDPVKDVDCWTLSTNWKSTRTGGSTAVNEGVLAVTSGTDNTSRGDIKNTIDSYHLDANKVVFIELACTAEGSKTNWQDRKVSFSTLIPALDAETRYVIEQFVAIESVNLTNGHELLYFNLAAEDKYNTVSTPVIFKEGDTGNKLQPEQKAEVGAALAAQQKVTIGNVGFTLINAKVEGQAVPTNYNVYKMGSAKDIATLAAEYGFTPTAISEVEDTVNAKAAKMVVKNGRLVIEKNGKQWSVAGQEL